MKRVKIVYYSGTGGTQRAAMHVVESFQKAGWEASLLRLAAYEQDHDAGSFDLLVLMFAVHAFNAPEPVLRWIGGLDKVNGIPVAVVSVSGGGEMTTNTACRLSSIRGLRKKGYRITYEEMLVMPSNVIATVAEPLALKMLEVLPEKAEKIVSDLDQGVQKRLTPKRGDRLISRLGKMEQLGAHAFGKHLHHTEKCDSCGWCSRNCPAGNITMTEGGPAFGKRCNLCMCCIYGCPQNAIQPKFAKMMVLKDGYSLDKLEAKLPLTGSVDVEELAKGGAWSGVREYLTK